MCEAITALDRETVLIIVIWVLIARIAWADLQRVVRIIKFTKPQTPNAIKKDVLKKYHWTKWTWQKNDNTRTASRS